MCYLRRKRALFVKDTVGISFDMPNSMLGDNYMVYDVFGVYLIDFKKNVGAEFSGKHYAVVLATVSGDNTILVAPITSKRSGKKYKGGFTIDCNKYQKNPSTPKAFVRIKKMREIDIKRIYGDKIYTLDDEDKEKLKKSFYNIFNFLL